MGTPVLGAIPYSLLCFWHWLSKPFYSFVFTLNYICHSDQFFLQTKTFPLPQSKALFIWSSSFSGAQNHASYIRWFLGVFYLFTDTTFLSKVIVVPDLMRYIWGNMRKLLNISTLKLFFCLLPSLTLEICWAQGGQASSFHQQWKLLPSQEVKLSILVIYLQSEYMGWFQ